MPSRRALAFLLLAAVGLPSPTYAQNGVDCRISVAPPPLPVYDQPPIPAPGYLWAPGYWAWGDEGYYWAPGTWVEPPSVGMLWTPGYWGWSNRAYIWHAGYWGPHIGFYGGINYGFGYVGVGYEGGRWENGRFAYNETVTNIGSAHITNVYRTTIVNSTTITNTSFNGGNGGTTAQPTPQEQAAERDPHIYATAAQAQHERAASADHALLASVNNGKPAIAATTKPGELSGHGIVAAKEAGTPSPVTPATEGEKQNKPDARGASPVPANKPATTLTTPNPTAAPELQNPKREEGKAPERPIGAKPEPANKTLTAPGVERHKETPASPGARTASPSEPSPQERKHEEARTPEVRSRPEPAVTPAKPSNPAVASKPDTARAGPHPPDSTKRTTTRPANPQPPPSAHDAKKKKPDHG